MDEIQKAIEFSLNDTLNTLNKNLPKEPEEGSGIVIHFIELASGNLISRRFSNENKIEVNNLLINNQLIGYH